MGILSKVLYKKYGILIKESESSYFDITLLQNKNIVKSLNKFYNNCETRYFKKSKIKEISRHIIKEEIARGKHTPQGKGTSPDGKGPAGNITDIQMLATDEELYIEDTVNTASGKDAMHIEDEEKNAIHKDMPPEYMHIFAKNLRTKKLNKK